MHIPVKRALAQPSQSSTPASLPRRYARYGCLPAQTCSPAAVCRNRSRGTFSLPRTACAFFSCALVHFFFAASSSHRRL
jgi:hypothetical protein